MTDLQVRAESEHAEEPSPDDLLALAANDRPASMSAISSLAEDTVFGAGITTSGRPGTIALFANPFSGGMEEPLYVSDLGLLMHAWRPVGVYASDHSHDRGWQLSTVAWAIREVKVVIHPNGAVYAFAISDLDGTLKVFELTATEESLPFWHQVTIPGWTYLTAIHSIHVQYLGDEARTPVVFVTQTLWAGMSIVQTVFGAWDNHEQPWEPRTNYMLSSSDADEMFAIGYDDSSLAWLRYYTVNDEGDLWRTSHAAKGDKIQELADTGWLSGIGGFVGPTGFGAVGSGPGHTLRTFAPFDDNSEGGSGETQTLDLGGAYEDFDLWQDSTGMLHLYGVVDGSQLHVLHQLSWQPFDSSKPASFAPVWEVVQGNDKNKRTFAAMRPLIDGVDSYALDAYPDQMPNQVVNHDRAGAEGTVVYTQQVGTSYWEQETVRVNAVPSDLPITQHRYQTRVLVQDAYSSPVAGCDVTITSDAPVDLDIAGQAYRLRPHLPATVSTDLAGSLTMSIPAVGLATPTLHLTVPGVSSALTVQPAAEVHRFLAGAGTLPGHLTGLSEDALRAARTPDGTSPLFPALAPARSSSATGEEWPPTAQEVLTWCRGAFAVSAGSTLPSAFSEGLGEDEKVLAFSLQTHDPTRPATTVFSRAEDLDRFRAERGLTYDSEWFGDLVEGIRASVLSAAEVVVDVARSRISVLVNLANGAQVWLDARWDDAVSAAHAVEAVFSALGAKLADVVAWLSWPFAFADVWATKKALDDELVNLVANIKKATAWLRKVPAEQWTGKASQAIDDALAAMADVFGEQYMSRFEAGGPQPGIELPLAALGVHDFVRGPNINWLTELLRLAGYEDTANFTNNPFDELLANIAALPEWEKFGPDLEVVTNAMFELFDWRNPNSAKNILVTALLQTLEGLLKGGIDLAAAALPIVLDFLDAVMDQLVAWGEQPVGSQMLQNVYDYIQKQAGVTGQTETLTFGDLGILMGAYPATVLYKAIFGVAPFQPGASGLADLQVPGRLPEGLGGSEPPEKWASLKLFQGYFVIMMVADGPFDVQVNNIALAKSVGGEYWDAPKPYWVAWAYNHVLAYGIGDYPPFWGNEFPPEGWDVSDWGPTVMWVMSAVANAADLGCACGWGTFIGIFDPPEDDDPGRVGPNIYFALGAFRMVFSGLRYMDGDDRDYPFAKWNCAINVTSFESATTGWIRWGLLDRAKKKMPDWIYWKAAVQAKNYVDFICDWFAGWASIIQIAYEDHNPPLIASVNFPDATVGVAWEGTVEGALGMTPYDWHVITPTDPPAGTIPGFPPSLAHVKRNKDTPTTARLVGTPEKSEVGTWVFFLSLEDDYGPGFKYRTDNLVQLEIKPAPEDG